MSQLRVNLLGKFSARYADGSVVQFQSQKEEELFCYLIVNRDRPCPREALASLLWCESETARAKKYLRTALWHLRSDLAMEPPALSGPLLKTSSDWIQLRRGNGLWADIDAFDEAEELVQRLSTEQCAEEQIRALMETICLYQGSFLEGWYQEWCLYERERFQQIYFRLIDRVMEFCESHRDFATGLSLGMRLLRLEPARECTHRRMMYLYYLSGDRYSAIRQFERCVEALREELGVRPSRLTLDLYEQVRTACGAGPVESQAAFADIQANAGLSLPKILYHLAQVRRVLENIESQIDLEIGRLKTAVDKSRTD